MSTRSFGIITNVSGLSAGILVNSLDYSESVETAEARNQLGQVVDIAGYSNSKTVSVQGLLDSGKGSLATAGSTLSLDGKTWLIDSVSKRESNTGFCQVTISCRTSDNAQIYQPSGSSSSSSSL